MTTKSFVYCEYWNDDQPGMHVQIRNTKPVVSKYGLFGIVHTEDEFAENMRAAIIEYMGLPAYKNASSPITLKFHPENRVCQRFALKLFNVLEQPLEDAIKCIIDKYPELCV